MELATFIKEKAVEVENCLNTLLPQTDGVGSVLYDSMRYSTLAGGKRLRPCLFIAVLDALGVDYKPFLPFACGLEMIHTYSLIHDDLPAMDNDDLRRNRPTCHKVFGEAEAILAGDGLLTYAFSCMAASLGSTSAENILLAIKEVADGAGINGMVLGQIVDLEYEGKNLDLATLQFIHAHKTGALFKASIRSAAILGAANQRQLLALTQYAEDIGLIFQIADDILDVVGDEQILGKPVGSDAKNAKMTYPTLLGLAGAKQYGLEVAQKAKDDLVIFADSAELLRAVPDYFMQRDK